MLDAIGHVGQSTQANPTLRDYSAPKVYKGCKSENLQAVARRPRVIKKELHCKVCDGRRCIGRCRF